MKSERSGIGPLLATLAAVAFGMFWIAPDISYKIRDQFAMDCQQAESRHVAFVVSHDYAVLTQTCGADIIVSAGVIRPLPGHTLTLSGHIKVVPELFGAKAALK